MKGLVFILISTFFVGMIVGAYIHLMSRPADTGGSDVLSERPQEDSGFLIIADLYGGCMRGGCPSYRLSENGEYIYLTENRLGEDVRYEDRLSARRVDEMRTEMARTNLARTIGTTFSGTCPAAYDGPAYRFTIALGESEYTIDSCKHDIAQEKLFNMLEDFFTIFELSHLE